MKRFITLFAVFAVSSVLLTTMLPAQQGGGRGGGGRGGGLPGATAEQTQAVADMNAALTAQSSAVTAARAELASATFAVKDEAAIKAAIGKLQTAELALATRRAEEFAKLQSGPNKLNPDQVAALIAAGGNPTAGRGGRGGPPGAAPPTGAGRGN